MELKNLHKIYRADQSRWPPNHFSPYDSPTFSSVEPNPSTYLTKIVRALTISPRAKLTEKSSRFLQILLIAQL